MSRYDKDPHREPSAASGGDSGFGELSGSAVVVADPKMQRLFELARDAAAGMINVLILGETGVGKDVMARRIHQLSPRARQAFVRVDCASLSETLLESELFGHEKGAFTGAVQSKPGLLESAPGGTIFLDEVGEIPVTLQPKLLHVLETRAVTRVGGVKGRAIDVRFIAATNRDLRVDVDRGWFRKDLYYRLNGFALTIPPLRERRAEIGLMAARFVAEVSKPLHRPAPRLAADAVAALSAYGWPGNVRELRNVVERAVLICRGDLITPEHLLFEDASPLATGSVPVDGVRVTTEAAFIAPAPVDTPAPVTELSARDARRLDEKQRIEAALASCGGNQSRAAILLGMPRSTFVLRLEQFGITRPRKGAPKRS